MAAKATRPARRTSTQAAGAARPRRRRAPRSRRRLRLVWLALLLAATAYLYSRPLSSYFETRGDLAARQAEVETLRVTKAGLELQLANATSLEATERAARRIGYVRPGEQLFVVKGIPAWRRAQRSLRADG
ncbi:MAG TPA: septum formation initiator family protein [Gaiellaceae bacterium]|nr:septum formation initiator family protein [Gaiellaceae bacterium]